MTFFYDLINISIKNNHGFLTNFALIYFLEQNNYEYEIIDDKIFIICNSFEQTKAIVPDVWCISRNKKDWSDYNKETGKHYIVFQNSKFFGFSKKGKIIGFDQYNKRINEDDIFKILNKNTFFGKELINNRSKSKDTLLCIGIIILVIPIKLFLNNYMFSTLGLIILCYVITVVILSKCDMSLKTRFLILMTFFGVFVSTLIFSDNIYNQFYKETKQVSVNFFVNNDLFKNYINNKKFIDVDNNPNAMYLMKFSNFSIIRKDINEGAVENLSLVMANTEDEFISVIKKDSPELLRLYLDNVDEKFFNKKSDDFNIDKARALLNSHNNANLLLIFDSFVNLRTV
jgi:hypothetical protein